MGVRAGDDSPSKRDRQPLFLPILFSQCARLLLPRKRQQKSVAPYALSQQGPPVLSVDSCQSGDSSEQAPRLPCKGKSVRNRGVSQTMPFLVIPRSLLRGGFIVELALQNCSCDRTSFGGGTRPRSFPFYLWHWQSTKKIALRNWPTTSPQFHRNSGTAR